MGEVNEALTKRNLELERQVKELSAQLYDKTKDSTFLHKGQYRFLSKFRLIQAKVVANSLDKPNNFITINKRNHGMVYIRIWVLLVVMVLWVLSIWQVFIMLL